MADDSLALGDEMARAVLAELAPFEFGEATAEGLRRECFALRYRALLEFDRQAAAHCVAGLERDDFDDHAALIIGRDGERTIATCRVVPPAPGRSLPILQAFALELCGRTDFVEWGRVVVDPDYRGDGSSIFMGLAAQAWVATRRLGYTAAIGATPKRLIDLFQALGFSVSVLGPPRPYWGEERYPILCEVQSSIGNLQSRWLGPRAPNPPGTEPPQLERTADQ